MADPSSQRSAYAALAASALAISTSAPLIFASHADRLAIPAWRLSLMFLLVVGALLVWQRGRMPRLPRREALTLVGLGAILGAHFVLWIPSVTMTTVAASSVLVTSHPLMVAAASHLWLKERVTAPTVGGILLAFSGVIVLFGTDFGSTERFLGDALALGGAITLGVYLLVGRVKRREGLPVLVYTTYVYGGAALFTTAVALAFGVGIWPQPSNELLLFFAMALVPGMFGHTLYNWSMARIRATVVAVTHLVEPIGATLLVFLFFGQTAPTATLAGGALTLAGVLLVARSEAFGAARLAPAADPPAAAP